MAEPGSVVSYPSPSSFHLLSRIMHLPARPAASSTRGLVPLQGTDGKERNSFSIKRRQNTRLPLFCFPLSLATHTHARFYTNVFVSGWGLRRGLLTLVCWLLPSITNSANGCYISFFRHFHDLSARPYPLRPSLRSSSYKSRQCRAHPHTSPLTHGLRSQATQS